MGVATRGVKFKFSSGEKVLCYEPDPTKAKVLYESKVLDLVVSRDERGRKVPEYLIHFFGWNSSWDRCVREEFILSFTDENRELQTKLANEAALSIKGKRKLPPLIKETLAKKFIGEVEKEKVSDSGSEADSSEEEIEVNIIIPEILKLQLEEDQRCITKKNKFVVLPCNPNVVAILEAFVKHSLAKMLCVSPPRNGKKLMPEDVQNKLSLYKEAMDGIRVCLDFTLPHLLLYPQEKRQYTTHAHRPFIKVEPNDQSESPHINMQPIVKRKRGRPRSVRTLRSDPRTKPPPPHRHLRPPIKTEEGRPYGADIQTLKPGEEHPKHSRAAKPEEAASEAGPSSSESTSATGPHPTRSLLHETLEWRMLPPPLYGKTPAVPSLLYGAQHLLRMFVKLPELISKMNISSRKLQPLLSILENFLAYLCEQRETLFTPSSYVDYDV